MAFSCTLPNSVLVRFLCSLILWIASEQALALGCTASYTYTNNGTNTSYSLTSGQSLKINRGTYTGSINGFPSNTTICVESGATFSPSTINNPAGNLINYGTANLATFSYNTGALIDNYGFLKFTGGLNFNGATTIRNRSAATISMVNSFTLNSASLLENNGLIIANQDLNTSSGTTITNNYRLEIEGNFNPSGILTNYGRIYAKKFINANSDFAFNNYCTLVSYDGFNNNSLFFSNWGTILVTSANGVPGGLWQNNQNFYNGDGAKVAGGNFTNNGAISGYGALIFSAETRNQGTFAGSNAANPINFYDETQTGALLFDYYNLPATNTIRTLFARPTELDAPTTCNNTYKSFAALSACPANGVIQNQSGTVTQASGNGAAVENASQAIGALQALDTTATASNSAKIIAGGVLTLDLGQVVPADAPITISLARFDTARVRVEVSLDGVVFSNKGTFGSSGTLGTSALNVLARLVINANSGGTQYIRLIREAGSMWVDGAEYSQTCLENRDYGDAPASYGVAGHKVVSTNLYLGDTPPDAESTSAHSVRANSDGDDEDGPPSQVVGMIIPSFAVLQMTDTSYSTTIRTTNQTGSVAKLSGWIDFDKNGSFDADERASVDVPTGSSNTNTTLTWASIPTDITLGTTYVRLRFSTDATAAMQATGTAPNGEVEDFVLPIHMDVPPNSPSISIASAATSLACQSVIFQDDFNDLTPNIYWGANRAGSLPVRSWTASGGGADTYARFLDWGLGYGISIYFGNGDVRSVSPSLGSGFSFDAQGKLLTTLDAIALRDSIDDLDATGSTIESHWGILPVTLSRSFATTVGKTYRLYFSALRETGDFLPGIMRVDAPGGSIHFKAPGGTEGILDYAIDFTATSSNSSISFINYGHFGPNSSGYCNVLNIPWCTVGGLDNNGKSANELSIDNVKLVEAACATGGIGGYVYQDANLNNTYDMGTETTIPAMTVKIYDEKGSSTDFTDDRLVATQSSFADGHYLFEHLDASASYRVEVDMTDPDLPSGLSMGTPNPFSGLVPLVNNVKTANFGLDPAGSSGTDDYGDAPASYGTPLHTIVAGIYLGATTPDSETNAQPNVNATGDDTTGTDDEEGVTLPVMIQGQTATITATVTGAGGYLQGWVDFNGDGDFTDAGEQVATNIQDNLIGDTDNTTGKIAFTVSVPATATTNKTYSRFRWSTTSGLNSIAATVNGEVEDYAVTISANSSCSLIVTTTADSNNAANNSGSLRDAIECANANPALDAITFNISGSGVKTISPLSPLPAITDAGVSIDGSTQPGASCGITRNSSGAITDRIILIQIDGTNAGATANGLVINAASGVMIKGLSIGNFKQSGLRADNAPNTTIICNHLGLAADGLTKMANVYHGVAVNGVTGGAVGDGTVSGMNIIGANESDGVRLEGTLDNVIIDRNYIGIGLDGNTSRGNGIGYGGAGISFAWSSSGPVTAPINSDGEIIRNNVIAGNGAEIASFSGTAHNTQILSNYIGTDATGLLDRTDQWYGIIIQNANGWQIGKPGQGNVISGMDEGSGIEVYYGAVTVQSNYIGVGADGTTPLGNGYWGVRLMGGGMHLIGGTGVNEGNVIAYNSPGSGYAGVLVQTAASANIIGNSIHHNDSDGVQVISASSSASIRANTFYANTELGIDLYGINGVNANDVGDADTGANSLLNFPVFNRITANGSSTFAYDFNLDVPANTNGYRIEFFKNSAMDPTGYGEGQVYLGYLDIAHAGGNLNFTGNFTGSAALAANEFITATTTIKTAAGFGVTSEFSGAFKVLSPIDYSDAPATYGTPSHTMVSGISLGANAPDSETAPPTPLDGTGDDTTGTDDEDGVTIPALTQGQSATITATVTGAGGYLQGWIDWNGDGDFADAGEWVINNVQDNLVGDSNNTAGIIAFNVTVPAGAVTTQTYARFRWSTTLGLDSTAAAINGEVEDYGVIISPAINAPTIIGEYRFDDCGSGGWQLDSSGNNNSAIGTAQIQTDNYKNYACTAVSNVNWNMEVPDQANYALASGAVSILFYDHKGVWASARLLEKGWTADQKLSLEMKPSTDWQHGTVSVNLNGNVIDTGETYYTSLGNGSLNDTQWVHAVLSFGPAGMKLYINGVLKGSNAYTGGITGVLGNFRLPGVEGYFDEFYIFNQQPTDAQVSILYSNLLANKTWDGNTRTCNCSGGVSADYGDAPASYGEVSHKILSSIYLGENPPDAETASKYSFNARADNYDDGAPQQAASGVYIPLFPVLQLTDSSYSVNFKVTNLTGTAGKLHGWIDFDKSGTFEADEAAVVDVPSGASNATATLNWTSIPLDIQLGTVALRLRLSTDASVVVSTPTGSANDGEVEDYPIAIAMDIPPNSPSLAIVNGATPAACEVVVFQDNFNDLTPGVFWGLNRPGSQAVRDWDRSGGGNDTYAHITSSSATERSIYFGNGGVRQISPSIGTGFSFDANGKLLTVIDAIALRDDMDDIITPGTTVNEYGSKADWGPEPVKFSRSFATVAGKTYRLYFTAKPEDPAGTYESGIMRLDMPGGSLHFKAPGSAEGVQSYAVEFTANSASSAISFINYGHVEHDNNKYCDPNSVFNNNVWCTVGGRTDGKVANELIIDDVVLTEAACATGSIRGRVYLDSDQDNNYDAGIEAGLNAITVSLYDENGTPGNYSDDRLVNTNSTYVNGEYYFTEVNTSRSYRLEVDTTDSDLPVHTVIGTTNPLTNRTVVANTLLDHQHFGFDLMTPSKIVGTVYLDNNTNDSFNPGIDYGIGNITVSLHTMAGALVASTQTAINGKYQFANLDHNLSYRITVDGTDTDLPPGATLGTVNPIPNISVPQNSTVTKDVGFDQAANGITGKVFLDYNLNGQLDSQSAMSNFANNMNIGLAFDKGIANAQIKAECVGAAGKLSFGPVTSDVNGQYYLATPGAVAGNYNCILQLTTLPSGYTVATQSGSGQQVLTQVVSPNAVNTYFALQQEMSYCQNNPDLAVNRFAYGQQTANAPFAGNNDVANIFAFPYNSGTAGVPNTLPSGYDHPLETDSAFKDLALANQVGSVFGLGWHPSSHSLFASAYMKAWTGFGSGGTGGIYRVDLSNPSSPVSSLYANLNQIFPATPPTVGSDPYLTGIFSSANPGYVQIADGSSAPDGSYVASGNATRDNQDGQIAAAVGKTAFGDLDVSADGKSLFVVNMANNKLYILPVRSTALTAADAGFISSYNIPFAANCRVNGTKRAFGLGEFEGGVYVATQCGTEQGQIWEVPEHAIFRFDLQSKTFSTTPSLMYARSSEDSYGIDFSLITDIVFDPAGQMILTFRNALESPYGTTADNGKGSAYSVIRRACIQDKATYRWEKEHNASCGGVTTPGKDAGYGTGPSSGTFFYQEYPADHGPALRAASYGGAAQIPGFMEMAYTVSEPFEFYSVGVSWVDTGLGNPATAGQRNRAYSFYQGTGAFEYPDNRPVNGKNAAIGDLEVLCGTPSLEIGNRVWQDTDSNGIQDAGETPIAGVKVELFANGANLATATPLATVLTDTNGYYVFSSDMRGYPINGNNAPNDTTGANGGFNAADIQGGRASTTSHKYGLLSLTPKTQYQVVIRHVTGTSKQVALATATLTLPTQGTDTERDSDGALVGNHAVATVSMLDEGHHAHAIDFGFISGGSSIGSIAGKVFEDKNYGGGAGRNASATGTVGISGAQVELYNSTGNFVSNTTTASDGFYSFSAIPAGNYFVRVVNASINSTRSGSNGSELGVQTFRTNGTVAVTNEVGGRKPDATDAEAHDGTATLNTTTLVFSGGGMNGKQAQSVTPVTVSGALSGVDFGFNFDTIVNTNDSGQGSLRQFILNANLLGGEASLAQVGLAAGKERSIFMLPSNDPRYINADGVANNGDEFWRIPLLSGLPETTGAETVLDASTQAGAQCSPVIGRRLVVELDGSNVNTVAGTAISLAGARNGVRGFAIGSNSGNQFTFGIYLRKKTVLEAQTPAHDSVIACNNIGATPSGQAYPVRFYADAVGIFADNVTVGGSDLADRNIIGSADDDGVESEGNATLIRNNYIGLAADGVSKLPINDHAVALWLPGSNMTVVDNKLAVTRFGIFSRSASTTVRNNTIGLTANGQNVVAGGEYLLQFQSGNALAENNVFASGGAGGQPAVILMDGSTFQNNTLGFNIAGISVIGSGSAHVGISLRNAVGTANTPIAIHNNTIGNAGSVGISFNSDVDVPVSITRNLIGVAPNGIIPASNAWGGIAVNNNASSPVTIGGANLGNIIANNVRAAITHTGTGVVTINQNSIYNNSGLGIDLSDDAVTTNDAGDVDAGPNGKLNFPLLQQLVFTNGNLIVRGCAPAGSVVELFEADVSSGGTAAVGANRFGRLFDYGEGQRYLGSFMEGAAVDADTGSCAIPTVDGNNNTGMNAFQFSIPAPASVLSGDYLTATATLAAVGTSEFSPTVAVMDGPPPVGSGSCAATGTGGTDILFIVDNSGSITELEYADFAQTIQTVGSQLLVSNPKNRIAVAHFGGPSDSLVSGGQYVYIERDFSSTAMLAPVRQFAWGGAYNPTWTADHLAAALQQMRYALDGQASTTSSYIVSPLKETSRNTASPLQIVLMTDADRYLDNVPNDISMLIDPPGSGAEPDDGSAFTVYNQMKAEGVLFSVVSFNPDPPDIAASAAIASVGGTYTGNIEANPQDPQGSQVTPRRYVSVTAGFQLTNTQLEELVEGTAICGSSIQGRVFEDPNYGGGAGRPFGSLGTVGVTGASIEVYDQAGNYVASVVSAADGKYSLPNLPDAPYYVRVVDITVKSSRLGSNGSEIPVLTYRTDGVVATANQIGGNTPLLVDAGVNLGAATLNTTTFLFNGGGLTGKPAQSVQRVNLSGGDAKGVDFGFNFSTVVNTNDSGQGSLRQFLLNNKVLATTNLAQVLPASLAADYPVGTETSIFMIPISQLTAGQAVITLTSGALSLERMNTAIDGRTQIANMGSGSIVLDNSITNGLNLLATATGSVVRDLTISHAAGSGLLLDDTDNAVIERVNILNNSQYGVSLINEALNNRVVTNTIAHNTWAGIAHIGNGLGNTYSQNSIHNNGGLGIDLNVDGVTANDELDVDTGPNKLLNYPVVEAGSSISSNGTKVVAYDFDLDVPNNTHGYRLEFFRNTAVDSSTHGEGEIYLGYVDINHAGGELLNFKGSLNANQTVPANANIAVTLTEKTSPTSLGSTSEFSGVKNGSVSVCTDLINGTGAEMTVNENAPVITYLEATDDSGNPITYVISGGADGHQFIVQDPAAGATLDCALLIFRKPDVVVGARSSAVTKALPVIRPGDYEAPTDSGGDNSYNLTLTATVNGQTYERPVTVGVQDINEAPEIINETQTEFLEGKTGVALNLESFDPDAGDAEGTGISYALSGGADREHFKLNPQTGELSFTATPDFEQPMDAGNDNIYDIDLRVMDDQGLSSVSSLKIAVMDDNLNEGIYLQTKVLLQGPYNAANGLMQDSLRTTGLLPVSQPYQASPFNYSGTEQLNLDLATVVGKDALVDWVLLELRDATNPKTILASKAALVQRDGDVVDALTGAAVLNFPVATGNYLVSVRHRNHLGVRTASAVTFGSQTVMLDFSQAATKVAGVYARLEATNLALLWAGDVNNDERLIATGIGSDTSEILNVIFKAPSNINLNSSYRLLGYLDSDLNMDGLTLFMGPSNDANVLLGNLFLFPSNTGHNSNYIVTGGLAK